MKKKSSKFIFLFAFCFVFSQCGLNVVNTSKGKKNYNKIVDNITKGIAVRILNSKSLLVSNLVNQNGSYR